MRIRYETFKMLAIVHKIGSKWLQRFLEICFSLRLPFLFEISHEGWLIFPFLFQARVAKQAEDQIRRQKERDDHDRLKGVEEHKQKDQQQPQQQQQQQQESFTHPRPQQDDLEKNRREMERRKEQERRKRQAVSLASSL